jgi:hypothetical protein
VATAEALLADVAALADDLGGDEGTDPGHLEERMTGDELGEPDGQAVLLLRQRSEVGEALTGELGLDASETAEESSNGALVADRDEVRCPFAVPRHEDPQVGMKSVAGAGHLGDDVLAGLDEQRDVTGPVRRSDR